MLREFRDARDWGKFHDTKNLALSISIEAAELLEIFQWSKDNVDIDGDMKDKIADEAADVFLYTLMLFDSLGLDPAAEAYKKIKINEDRFPIPLSYGKPKPDKEL
ncbi:nucleotide pyrophosphohydrolase [Methylobacterium hispanicum]